MIKERATLEFNWIKEKIQLERKLLNAQILNEEYKTNLLQQNSFTLSLNEDLSLSNN